MRAIRCRFFYVRNIRLFRLLDILPCFGWDRPQPGRALALG
jgi:hypothetical protein